MLCFVSFECHSHRSGLRDFLKFTFDLHALSDTVCERPQPRDPEHLRVALPAMTWSAVSPFLAVSQYVATAGATVNELCWQRLLLVQKGH